MNAPLIVIDSKRSTASLSDVWAHRELLGFFVWRDLKVRYRQTALGAGWALLQPLATMAVFAVIFGRLLGVPSEDVPYPAFVLAALVPWTYLASSLGNGSTALLTNQNLLAKVYFPRLLLPAAAVVTPAADAVLAFGMALIFFAWHGLVPRPAVVVLPFFALLAGATALGASSLLSALTVRFRDVRYTLPFAMQLWLFASPVAYPTSTVPAAWRPLYALNPMVTVIDGFRWTLLGTAAPAVADVLISTSVAVLLVVAGVRYFRSVERSFADII